MLDHRTLLRVALLSASSVSSGISYGQDMREIVEAAFRRSILKVEVSTTTPVFSDGINVCKSEGTAFLVGENLAVTASHVYALNPSCGSPTILLESAAYKVQTQAEVVAVAEDITLLRFGGEIPPEMCTLALSSDDAASVQGVRFGIPQGMMYATPKPVRIGSSQGDFMPFIELTPTPAEQGESGGPVVYMFSVVGVLRAKHAKYPAYSVMTPIGQFRTLLNTGDQPFILGGKLCNPVEVTRTFQTDGVNMRARLSVPSLVSLEELGTPSPLDDCPTCSITKVRNSDQGVTIEVRSGSPRSHVDSEAVVRAMTQAAKAAGSINLESSQASAPLVPRSSASVVHRRSAQALPMPPPHTPSVLDDKAPAPTSDQRLQEANWQYVKRVSDDIAKETRSRAWDRYVEEMKRDAGPTP